MKNPELFHSTGFEEIEHTSDWSYRVWAQSLTQLFIQAAIALYKLADIQLTSESTISFILWGSIFCFSSVRNCCRNSNLNLKFEI